MNKNERQLLSTELLRTFVTIANCGNVTMAASHLHRTQSAISVQIRKLEADIGSVLFTRNSKGMTLTDAGKTLLPNARAILADIERTGRLFEKALRGSIHVGIPDDFDDRALERILVDFTKSHPGVDVVATSGCTSGYPDSIKLGNLDIAVYSAPDNGLGEPLGREKTVWACKKGLQIEAEKPIPLAILDTNCWWKNAPIEALASTGREYSIVFQSISFSSIRAAIRSGIAVGILPASCVGENITVLSRADGFPDLPYSKRSILTADDAPRDLTNAMAEAIRNALIDPAV